MANVNERALVVEQLPDDRWELRLMTSRSGGDPVVERRLTIRTTHDMERNKRGWIGKYRIAGNKITTITLEDKANAEKEANTEETGG